MTKKLNGKLLLQQTKLNALLAKQLTLNADVARAESQMVQANIEAQLTHQESLRTHSAGMPWPTPDLRMYNKLQVEHAELSRQARVNQLEIVEILKKMSEEIPAPPRRESTASSRESKL